MCNFKQEITKAFPETEEFLLKFIEIASTPNTCIKVFISDKRSGISVELYNTALLYKIIHSDKEDKTFKINELQSAIDYIKKFLENKKT